MTSRLPGLVVTLGRLLVTAVMLWVILRTTGIDTIAQVFARTDPVILFLALSVLVLQFFVMAWRWQVLLRVLFRRKVAITPLVLSIGQGMLASQALPATIGGDAYRVALVAGQIGMSTAVRSVLCDRVLALATLIAFAALLWPVMVWRLGPTPAVVSVGVAVLAGLAAFVAIVGIRRQVVRIPFLGPPLAMVASDAQRALNGREAHFASILAFATHLLGVVLIYLLALSIKTPIGLMDCLLIVPPALVVSALPISLGGWGVREGAFLAGFTMVGGDPAGGVTVSVLFGLTGIFLGGISGALAFAAGRRHKAAR